jgi:CRP/FNR family transcriptional regulator
MFDCGLSCVGSAGNEAVPAAEGCDWIEPAHDVNLAAAKLADVLSLLGAPMPADRRLLDVAFPVRKVKAGETLHRAGDKFKALYVVRSGFFKTVAVDEAGAELVLGFPMGGDVVGVDGVDSGRYMADVIALDISSVAVIPFAQLAQLAREFPCIERLLYSIFSRELVHKHAMFRLLGTLSAEARLASFLLDLSDRFGRLGYSRSAFALRATRQEIGSYLGLKLETVSRTLSAFAAAGLVDIDRRQVTLRDVAGLHRIVAPGAQRAADLPVKRSIAQAVRRPSRALADHGHLAMAA